MVPYIGSLLKLFLLSAILFASLSGCFDDSHDFRIRFGDVYGLRKGDLVYTEESEIGKVEAVDHTTTGDFLVSVSIRKAFTSAATDDSRFYIEADPQSSEQKAIWVVQFASGGNPIEEGATVEGQTKYAILYGKFAYQMRKNISILESGLNEFVHELQGISESDQIREIERQLDKIIADLGNMSSEMKHKLENEILPLLREKIEELRKSIENNGQEDELERINRKMDAISEVLHA